MLSKLQEDLLNKTDKKMMVISSAASGKTMLMTEKTRQLLRNGVDPKKIAVITFTNMAAEELRQRLGADYKDGIFIGTIHALANYFLLSSGISTEEYIQNEKFDELFHLVKENPQCVKNIDWVLLDEAQDSSDSQFHFIFDMIDPQHFLVVGDPKQSIYQFSGARPELLDQLAEEDDVTVYSLYENYRNGKKILDYAKRIIMKAGMWDDSIAMRDEIGRVYEVELAPKRLCQTIKARGAYKTWAILCRTNAQVEQMGRFLIEEGVPFDTFKQGDLKKDELTTKMNEETVKVLTIHSSKGLEWDNVIVVGARFYPIEERNLCYVAATRARNTLVWTAPKQKAYKPKSRKTESWE